MTTPVALYLQDAHTITEGIELVRYAEQQGFDAVWQADSRLVRDAVVPMAAFAASTSTIKVGSGVIDIWTRNPARLASTFSTLDDLAPGRIICGLGAWWDPLARKVGIHRERPLTVMREVVTVVRALLANETVTFDGHFAHLDGVELDYVHQERRAKDVPIYIGATGMQMMELTGELADGAVLNYLVSPAYNLDAIAALERGAAKAGRTIDQIDRPQLVVCSVDQQPSGRARRRSTARHPVPGPAAAHHEGIRRAAGAARRDRQGAHLAGDARPGRGRQQAGARRHRADDHRQRRARRSAGEGGRVRGQRVHLPDPVPAG